MLRKRLDCDVRTIGIRATRLPAELSGVSVIIMAGLAGALDPSLKIGDVVIDDLSDEPGRDLQYPRVKMHTADGIAATPEDRRRLQLQTGAAVVEMENATVRPFARRIGAKYFGIRAISDCADDVLDPAIAGLVDDVGRVKGGQLARSLLRRPMLIGELNRLRKNSSTAMEKLAEALRTICSKE